MQKGHADAVGIQMFYGIFFYTHNSLFKANQPISTGFEKGTGNNSVILLRQRGSHLLNKF